MHKAGVHDKGGRFSCELCGKNFMRQGHFKDHMLSHSKERNHKCSECECAFKTNEALKLHIDHLHPTETPFQCEVCSKSFSRLSFLKQHSVKHSEDKPHKCDRCSSAFKLKYYLTKHKAVVHDKGGKFSCELCGKKFMRPGRFKEHMLSHSEERNHKCSECESTFKSEEALKLHIVNIHPTETPFRCEVCLKSFSRLSFLKQHSVKHTEDKPHKCDQCSSAFKLKRYLSTHKAVVHDKERRFSCALCGKKFTTQGKLRDHTLRHGEDRQYKCGECECTFKTKVDLTNHISKLHPTDTPFQCKVCLKSFSRLWFLNQHSAKHNEDKPHKCNQCSSAFRLQYYLSKHKAVVHGKEGKFPCELCGKKFTTQGQLKEHTLRHGEDRHYKCNECECAFKTKPDLRKHISILHPTKTPFQCEACSKSFSQLSLLKKHTLKHNKDESHKCDQCSSAYKLKQSLNAHKAAAHDKERRFCCELCGKKFVLRSQLKDHTLRHGKDRNFKCGECECAFKTKPDLKEHIAIVHPTETPFQCEVCSKSFSKLSYLKVHSLRHSDDRKFKCDLCPSTFKANFYLNRHKKRVHSAPKDGPKGDDIAEVKVEPVELYDPVEKRVLSDMDVEIKHEPEESNVN